MYNLFYFRQFPAFRDISIESGSVSRDRPALSSSAWAVKIYMVICVFLYIHIYIYIFLDHKISPNPPG